VDKIQMNATQLANKMVQEKSAGVHSLDVFLGATSAVPVAYDAKLYAPLKPQLVIPDISDSSKWIGGQVSYMDKEAQYVVRMDRQLRYMVMVNPDIVKPDQLKTPQDLLKPEFKGKIGAFDPSSPGAGQSIGTDILKIMGPDYVKSLYVGQQVKLTSEQRVLGDWVAHGTYPIVIGLPVDEYVNVKNTGLPVARAMPGELTATITSVLLWGVMDGAQHPNAAKLFLNWVMTKDGMQTFVDQMQTAVIRTDMDYSKMNPEDVPSATAKYFDEGTWDYVTGEKPGLIDQIKTLVPRG
jgi:iron(III) transport system substrate-binding protein